MSGYSQGVAQDGAAILHHGIPMSPEEIVLKLNHYAAIQAELATLKQQLAGRWMGVDERLPKQAGDVLCFYYGARCVLGFDGEGTFYDTESLDPANPDFWMPLPPPPGS